MTLSKIKKPTCSNDYLHNAAIDFLRHKDTTGDVMIDSLWMYFEKEYSVELKKLKSKYKNVFTEHGPVLPRLMDEVFYNWLKNGYDVKFDIEPNGDFWKKENQ